MGLYTFAKEERIRKRSDFLRIPQEGAKYRTNHFSIALCSNDLGYRRWGMVVGKRVGSAVKRNRLKRLLREFFRLRKENLPSSCDLVIVAREGAADLNFQQVCEELQGLFQEI
jgi:ribonuclease P protein component